ncbi:hypothetical protein ABW21_db0205746 [Orbilia brochopaga]|nr:hypothetical protein ABW21_db0205746 [Drechslerella brochopaga]
MSSVDLTRTTLEGDVRDAPALDTLLVPPDRQKCLPIGSDWPEKCTRCIRKGLPCSPRSQTKGLPRRKPGSGNEPGSGSGSGGGPSDPYGGEDQDQDEFQDYEYYEGDEAGYPVEYGHDASGNYQYGNYGQGTYGAAYQNYPGYDQQQYGQETYVQPLEYNHARYAYNYQ